MDEFDIHDPAGLTRHAVAVGVAGDRILFFRFSAKTNLGLPLPLRPFGGPIPELPV
jgi:hypothetical protein